MRWEMRDGSGSSQPGDIEKHFEVWEGKVLRTGSVRGAEKVKTFESALGLNQATNRASQPGPAAAAAGPPTADGGGARLNLLPRMAAVAPTPLDLQPRMAAVAVAPTHRSSSWHVRSPRWKLKSYNSNKGTEY